MSYLQNQPLHFHKGQSEEERTKSEYIWQERQQAGYWMVTQIKPNGEIQQLAFVDKEKGKQFVDEQKETKSSIKPKLNYSEAK